MTHLDATRRQATLGRHFALEAGWIVHLLSRRVEFRALLNLWQEALPDIKIMSGDGVFEAAWYEGTGDAGNGTYLTFGGVGPNEQTSEAGKQWVADYKASHDGEDPPVYGIYGAAAAQLALDALTRAGTNDRYEVLKAVFATQDFESYLGTFSINEEGDSTLAEATGYQIVDSWPPKFEKVLAAPE